MSFAVSICRSFTSTNVKRVCECSLKRRTQLTNMINSHPHAHPPLTHNTAPQNLSLESLSIGLIKPFWYSKYHPFFACLFAFGSFSNFSCAVIGTEHFFIKLQLSIYCILLHVCDLEIPPTWSSSLWFFFFFFFRATVCIQQILPSWSMDLDASVCYKCVWKTCVALFSLWFDAPTAANTLHSPVWS